VDARRMQHIRVSQTADMELQAQMDLIDASMIADVLDLLFEVALPFINDGLQSEIKNDLHACVTDKGHARLWIVDANKACEPGTKRVKYKIDPMDLTAQAQPRIVPIHEHTQCFDFRALYGMPLDEMNDSGECNGIRVHAEGGCKQLTGMSEFKLVDLSVTGAGQHHFFQRTENTMRFVVDLEAQFPKVEVEDCHFSIKETTSNLGFSVKAEEPIKVGKFTVRIQLQISKAHFVKLIKDFVKPLCKGTGVTELLLNNLQLRLVGLDFAIPEIKTPKWTSDKEKKLIELVPGGSMAFTAIADEITKVLKDHMSSPEALMQNLFKQQVNEIMKDKFKVLREDKWAIEKIDELIGGVVAKNWALNAAKDVACGFEQVAEFLKGGLKKLLGIKTRDEKNREAAMKALADKRKRNQELLAKNQAAAKKVLAARQKKRTEENEKNQAAAKKALTDKRKKEQELSDKNQAAAGKALADKRKEDETNQAAAKKALTDKRKEDETNQAAAKKALTDKRKENEKNQAAAAKATATK